MQTRRTTFVIGATAVCALIASSAQAGSRKPDRPVSGKKVTVSASGNTVRYTKARAGTAKAVPPARANPAPVHCNRWSTTEVTGTGEAAITITHRWKQCFSVATGRPTGQLREILGDSGSTPNTTEIWTAVVPDPVILRENSNRFVAQRLAYLWLPLEYFHGIRVDLRSSDGGVLPGAATARATQVIVHPGWGSEDNTTDCTVDAQFPYDRSVGYWDQRSCALVYMKSSIDEPNGAYVARATVTWAVTAVIEGEVADPATVVTQGETAVRVEELQALVTCIGGGESSCIPSRSTRKK